MNTYRMQSVKLAALSGFGADSKLKFPAPLKVTGFEADHSVPPSHPGLQAAPLAVVHAIERILSASLQDSSVSFS